MEFFPEKKIPPIFLRLKKIPPFRFFCLVKEDLVVFLPLKQNYHPFNTLAGIDLTTHWLVMVRVGDRNCGEKIHKIPFSIFPPI
jgi:hypothetical protein